MERDIKDIIKKLVEFEDYTNKIELEVIETAKLYHEIFLEKFKELNNENNELYDLFLDKAVRFNFRKFFNKLFDNLEIVFQDEKQEIINGILCYSCCDRNHEALVQLLIEELGADIYKKNKNINLSPYDLAIIFYSSTNNRLLNNLIIYSEQNIEISQESAEENYYQDLSLYISNILEENKTTNNKKQLTALNELDNEEDFDFNKIACKCIII